MSSWFTEVFFLFLLPKCKENEKMTLPACLSAFPKADPTLSSSQPCHQSFLSLNHRAEATDSSWPWNPQGAQKLFFFFFYSNWSSLQTFKNILQNNKRNLKYSILCKLLYYIFLKEAFKKVHLIKSF